LIEISFSNQNRQSVEKTFILIIETLIVNFAMTTKKKEEKGNKGNKLSERETETARKIEDDIFISI